MPRAETLKASIGGKSVEVFSFSGDHRSVSAVSSLSAGRGKAAAEKINAFYSY